MFDIGWTEMMVVAVVAILFVGPKELPGMLRTFGRTVKKLRAMAREFQGQFDQAIRDADLDGVKSTIDDVRNLDPTKAVRDKLNPLKDDLERTTSEINDGLNSPHDYDPATLFNQSANADADVDAAALDRQAQVEAANAAAARVGAGKTATAKKPAAKKPAAKSKPRAAANKAPAKKASTSTKAKPRAAAKTAGTSKTAVKKSAAKKPAAKKTPSRKPSNEKAGA